MTAPRYICIHGHFYQPPRENPWLEAIEVQDSAQPYHDWNERISDECYAPNRASRILDGAGRIERIVNNYERISFNFGPTLLSWMQANDPDTYRAILHADAQSRARFGGHGSALAQGYNHMIMPLANRRDKVTQVRWGIRDFETRFGRRPEGMWLPETAVDLETLDILAEHGIGFTILAPHQAKRVRLLEDASWTDVDAVSLDTHHAYLCRLPSGRRIALFFYDGAVARAVAFERLLNSGEAFAHRLAATFDEEAEGPQLMHIATDGETYGHHHRHGDMALAYALASIEKQGLAQLTNYGAFLAAHPPQHEVEIMENTAWSCAHGVGRWSRDCGCNTGGRPGWNQAWREPLREALDWLRDTLAAHFAESGRAFFEDPWAARDSYIDVILDRSRDSTERFLQQVAVRDLTPVDRVTALELLELQRHAMLMYTSCGWFFDELSGIETVQVLQYAGRAIQLASRWFGSDYETEFLDRLARAKSNIAELGDGRQIFERMVRPAQVDLVGVGAHYAISSLFSAELGPAAAGEQHLFCYTVRPKDYRRFRAGQAQLGAGRLQISSSITGRSIDLVFGVTSFGDHSVTGGVCSDGSMGSYDVMVRELEEAFSRADFVETVRTLDRHFRGTAYGLEDLFRDERRRILDVVLKSSLQRAEDAYSSIYDDRAALLRFLSDLHVPLPAALRQAAQFVLNERLARAFASEAFDMAQVRLQVQEAKRLGIDLDAVRLSFVLEASVERLTERWRGAPEDARLLEQLNEFARLWHELPFEVDLWKTQNIYYDLLGRVFPAQLEAASRKERRDERAVLWVEQFRALGERLAVRVEALPAG